MQNTVPDTHFSKLMDSPTGMLKLVATDQHLVAVLWNHEIYPDEKVTTAIESNNHPLLLETEQQLNEYFDKKRKVFDLPLYLNGTPFQNKVWELLMTIPFGETKSYGYMAKQLGDMKIVRAVGGALHVNPIPIIVPCHRVIGASGKLVGFGGGLDNKRYLLNLEQPAQPDLWAQI
jgi:methylated-DNA-[protein]-cysteine S-methyltransferase